MLGKINSTRGLMQTSYLVYDNDNDNDNDNDDGYIRNLFVSAVASNFKCF
jgi:hypothetical protein